MNPLLQSLRESPLSLLPQKSLGAMRSFLGGYIFRSWMEEKLLDLGFDQWEVHRWFSNKFQVKYAEAIADITIVSSFFGNESDAFDTYFNLLDEFLSQDHSPQKKISESLERKDFVTIIRAIREKPAMYLGHASFLNCSSYLMGDERAYADLGLPEEESREIFRDFQRWVEADKNSCGQHRPWFKVIEFWSGGMDSGSTGGAYNLLFSWLDQYTKQIGKSNLFAPADWPTKTPSTVH